MSEMMNLLLIEDGNGGVIVTSVPDELENESWAASLDDVANVTSTNAVNIVVGQFVDTSDNKGWGPRIRVRVRVRVRADVRVRGASVTVREVSVRAEAPEVTVSPDYSSDGRFRVGERSLTY